MTKRFKNNKEVADTWAGQTIQPGQYFTIEWNNLFTWQNDSKVLTDIGSGDGIMNDGTSDIEDAALAINFLKDVNTSPKDTDGAPLTRTKITKSGWHFQLHSVEFSSATLNSLFNKDVDGNDLGFTSIKFYDNTDTELVAGTQAELDSDCVKTVVEWEPDEDIEIIGGIMEQSDSPTTDVRMWVTAVPDLTVAQGGSVPFIQGGLNLRRVSGRIDLDGKTPKEMGYDATYHTNKFRITLKHDPGVKCPLMILFKLFRLNAQ